MEQLTQELKSGRMEILEVPFPALEPGRVMVRNLFSVISAGTEGRSVKDARLGYLGKARSRTKEVKQVISLIRTQGLLPTYKMVMNRLEAPSALGYSCAGEVIALGAEIRDLKVGDFVACGGSDAVHAEVVAVPRNLCVKVPSNVDIRHAAFTTIAAIALQGIRQTEARTGEYVAVIGLGLIGQLTVQILQASGIRAIGIDVDEEQVRQSREMGIYLAVNRQQEGIENLIVNSCAGHGADAVIITAGSTSTDPVELAGRISRQKGKVVIVGAVPTGFSREHYYRKELDLRMSSSYGPGRYDSDYEEKGRDYPIGYVRWTENRNMQAFLQLLSDGRLNIPKIITHEFGFDQAPDAYSMILAKEERFGGILLRYENDISELKRDIDLNSSPASYERKGPIRLGFLGAGSFAQNILLPALKGKVEFRGVATGKGNHSLHVGRKYGFAYCSDNADRILSDPEIDAVFITTRHHLHASMVMDAIRAGKSVFVEKPLAMNMKEMNDILKVWQHSESQPQIMLGFNRRFAPAVIGLKSGLHPAQTAAIQIRVNAGMLPKDHWVHDPEIGGGRIIGEACHFIDLARHLAGSAISQVFATSKSDANALSDTVNISLHFANGSIAGIAYYSNGHKSLSKELIEVFCDGSVARIDDFRSLKIFGAGSRRTRYRRQDKGHAAEVDAFLKSLQTGSQCPIPFDEAWESMAATFAVLHSISTGQSISLQDFIRNSRENFLE
jgi:predicted dehydrogenase/threonine dehydrogenase-like Zn-dependent dehydrogenase